MTKSVCLHAAFLRSPRENPWTGELDPEDSAYPYEEWTSRAHAKCYGPFAFDPILDQDGRVRGGANLYAALSFSFSPLLLAWLERARPETYRRILDADRDSVRRLGRGNALAQPYGDAPLPGLSLRDRRTAVRSGKKDFQQRFGRSPEGLWLPAQAADEETLEVLISEGLAFTVLPAARAGRVRIAGGTAADWKEVRIETFNPARPYRWLSRQTPGRELALFFPHEHLGAALASGEALRDGETLWRGVKARFLPDESTQLVHAVNPGELYGLELKGAPGMLGQALRNLEADGVPATNYAAFLDRFPPPQEVELTAAVPREEPAWRGALRRTLQESARELYDFYAGRMDAVLDDPGEARDALLLIDLQRRRLLMLSESEHDSRDVTDAEPLQALKQACRAAELASALGLVGLAPALRERLAAVKTASGTPPDAAQLWSREVAPAAVDAERAAAHFAILGHLGVGEAPRLKPRPGERFVLLSSAVRRETLPLPGGRDPSWSWQRLAVRDAHILHTREAAVCMHQLERLDLAAWVLAPQDEQPDLAAAFAAAPAEEFRAELCRRFGQAFFTLDALLGAERLQVLRWLMPDPAGSRPRQVFLRDWAAAVGRLRRGETAGEDALLELLPRCREAGVPPDQLPWAGLARGAVQGALEAFLATGARPELDRALRWLASAQRAGLRLDLFSLRSRLLVWLEGEAANADAAVRDLARALAEKLGLSPSLFSPTEYCSS